MARNDIHCTANYCNAVEGESSEMEIEEKLAKVFNKKYIDRYTAMRNRARKEFLVELKGGKCERCGYNKSLPALDFHHRDWKDKKINVARACREFDDSAFQLIIIPEVTEKCELLCANCHREETWRPRKFRSR